MVELSRCRLLLQLLALATLCAHLSVGQGEAETGGGGGEEVSSVDVDEIDGEIHTKYLRGQKVLPRCSWQIKMGFNYTAQGLIDPEAIYYAQILPRINEKGIYKITGPYPNVRYFSYQVYSTLFSGDATHGLADFEIQPHWGKNPFSDSSATPETTGGYEIYITQSGKEGYPNEMGMPDANLNVLVMRMYKADPTATVLLQDMPPPYLMEGVRQQPGGSIKWARHDFCSHEDMMKLDKLADVGYQASYKLLSGNYPGEQLDCPLRPQQGNTSMLLFEGAWLSESIRNLVARRGKDSPYLFLCINPSNGQEWGTDPEYTQGYIIKMKMKVPRFANGLYRKWKVSEPDTWDVRYFSVSTADSLIPQPTIAAIDGDGIVQHYKDWNDWDGVAHFYMAKDEATARACGFWDPSQIFLPFSSDRIHPAKTPTIFLREVLPKGPKTPMEASKACDDGVDCGNAGFIRSHMEEGYYPELEIFHCDPKTRAITQF